MKSRSITLIGMAGVGKSTIGAIVAKRLHYNTIDIDKLMVEKTKMSQIDTIRKLGDKGFIQLEEETILGLKKTNDSTIFITGGSVVYSKPSMDHLKNISVLIYLDAEMQTIINRVDTKTRGIIGLKNKSLEEVFIERKYLYEKYADITIWTEGKSPYQIADAVEKLISSRG